MDFAPLKVAVTAPWAKSEYFPPSLMPMEASERLVGSSVFKTDEGFSESLAGSIPVRLRDDDG